jgi:hypothetical protein
LRVLTLALPPETELLLATEVRVCCLDELAASVGFLLTTRLVAGAEEAVFFLAAVFVALWEKPRHADININAISRLENAARGMAMELGTNTRLPEIRAILKQMPHLFALGAHVISGGLNGRGDNRLALHPDAALLQRRYFVWIV